MEKLRHFWRRITKKGESDELANILAESKWRVLEDTLKNKCKVHHSPRLNSKVMNDPTNLIPVVERAPPEEVIPILLQTIHNIQEDNDRGKQLAQRVVKENY